MEFFAKLNSYEYRKLTKINNDKLTQDFFGVGQIEDRR